MDIKPITSLTLAEIRDLAQAAADSSEPVHEACPADLSAEQRHEFESAYVERRHALMRCRVPEQVIW